MVTVTDDGLERVDDIVHGRVDDEIHAIAVGTGTGNEGTGADVLANEAYRSNKDNGDVRFEDTGGTGESEAVIEVTAGGGTANVAGGTEISEMAIFTEAGELIAIDEFAGVQIPTGHTEQFVVPTDYTR